MDEAIVSARLDDLDQRLRVLETKRLRQSSGKPPGRPAKVRGMLIDVLKTNAVQGLQFVALDIRYALDGLFGEKAASRRAMYSALYGLIGEGLVAQSEETYGKRFWWANQEELPLPAGKRQEVSAPVEELDL